MPNYGNNDRRTVKDFYLYFKLADNDEAVYPVSALRSVSCTGNTAIDLYFDPGILNPTGTDAQIDKIILTHTAGTELTVMKELADAINGNFGRIRSNKQDNYVMIADQIAGVYFSTSVTAITHITRSAA